MKPSAIENKKLPNCFARGAVTWGVAAACFAMTALIAVPAAAVDMFNDIDSPTLAKFKFQGLPLGSNVASMKKQFPTAQSITDKHDRQMRRERYFAKNLKAADAVRFFFVDDKLYQVEITYQEPRLLKLGGIETIRRHLVSVLGPADHAGEARWTWQQVDCNRRADLFGTPNGAVLVVTELSLVPVVEQRTR